MGRKLQRELLEENRVLLDTSFLLPYVGLRVEGIDEEVIEWLENLDLYYPYIMIPELIGVVFKVAKKKGLSIVPENALEGFNFIVYGENIHLISPIKQDLEIAYELIMMGLRDIFDAILYATSKRTGIKAITADKSLIKFIKENNLETNNLILIQ